MPGARSSAAEGLEDPSLLNDEDDAGVPSADKIDDGDKDDAGGENDIEVVIAEEETEDELEARQARERDGALDQDAGRREEDPDARYSKSVRERIEREQRIAREATARANAAHQGRIAAEATARARQKEALEVTDAALEMQAKSTREALVKAKDDGKTGDEVTLQEDLERINRRREALAESKKDLERQDEEAKRGDSGDGPTQLAQEWMARNKWFTDPRLGEQIAHVRIIDRGLTAAGFDKNTPEYYAELDRRIRRRLPELQRFMQAPRREQPRDRPREPTGGVLRRDAGGPAGAGKKSVTLTRADMENMRAFGLDPTDKKVLREYAMNKMSGGTKQ